MRESEIQKSIIQYLSYRKDTYYVRVGSGGIKTADGRYFKSGKKGCPDILICYKGRFIGLEVKNEKGKQSEFQETAKKEIEKVGGKYYIVKDIDDVVEILKTN